MDQHVELEDGRRLSYAEFGRREGWPLIYLHGFPGSRREARLAHDAAESLGVRLIAPDRPGLGGSTFRAGRKLVDAAADLAVLADRLGLGRFALLGASGGGPYALAAARFLGDRLSVVGVVAGLGPLDGRDSTAGMLATNRLALGLARGFPGVTRWWVTPIGRALARWPERFLDHLAARVAPVDQPIFERPEVRRVLAESLREAVRQGSRGLARELEVYAAPWGFEWSEIRPEVRLWHGDQDWIVPQAMGRRVASQLPRCRPRYLAGEGHFSLILGRAPEILRDLAQVD